MKIQKLLTFITVALVSCTESSWERDETMKEQILYTTEEYTVFSDRVTQGLYESAALNPTSMISNYQSPANKWHSRRVEFKFSLNGRDNELPPEQRHSMVLFPHRGMVSTPVIRFGEPFKDKTTLPGQDFLEPNTLFRIRLDMGAVLKEFKEKGYYESYNGDRLYQEDFQGVFVAGDTHPLSWEFEMLPDREELELKDPDGDGIYETTITLNPYNLESFKVKRWELQEDISAYPQFKTPQLLLEALYNLSLEELKLDIRPDQTFMAGKEWPGVWTRDISYSILLSLAAIEPEVSQNSLMKKVKRNRIIQDTGTGGSWPVSTDRVSWGLAAWEVYKVRGEREWLQQAFEIIRNTLEDDLKVAFDPNTGFFRGESSFLDWRDQSYPDWMEPAQIYQSQSLGTNAVHFRTYQILGLMAEELKEPADSYFAMAEKIKEGINKHLWVEEKGCYGQYLYGRHFLSLSPRAEGLGESLCVLFDISDEKRQEKVISQTPVVNFGIPSIYPQIPGIQPYHNNGIWPFVQAYWNWAAAKAGNEQVLLQGMGAMFRQAALFLTNKENMVAHDGDFAGIEINSDRQLWSVAGNLAMVYRVLYGMQFEPDGIRFAPMVPEAYASQRELKDFKYRNAVLEIVLRGWGNSIKEFKVDGAVLKEAFLPANLSGKHVVEINLQEQLFTNKPFNLKENHTSPATPLLQWGQNQLHWEAVSGAVKYQLWRNGAKIAETAELTFSPDPVEAYVEYQLAAVDKGGYASFLSEPLVLSEKAEGYLLEAEKFASKGHQDYPGFHGEGYVALTKTENSPFEFQVETAEAGSYLLDLRYSNGSGPVNTDNKAAIRSLFKEGAYISSVVFPQRGKGEWSNWGWSNVVEVQLQKGINQLSLTLESYNENMNQQVNTAMLDQIRLIRL